MMLYADNIFLNCGGACIYYQLKTCSSSEVAAMMGLASAIHSSIMAWPAPSSPPARDARDSCGPCCFWRGRLNLRGEA